MKEALKEKIRKSGNNLHLKTVDLLRGELGWEVELSPYYYDDFTNKPREIDIIANKTINLVDGKKLDIFLFIECKFFPDEVAFRLQEANRGKTFSAIITQGIERQVVSEISDQHHYFRVGKVGKLYDFASKNDFVFDAYTQSVKSLISYKKNLIEITPRLFYPMVIFEGIQGIYQIDTASNLENLESLEMEKNLIFSLKYEQQEFYIDFISFSEVPAYFKLIDNDISNFGSELKRFYANQPKYKTEY